MCPFTQSWRRTHAVGVCLLTGYLVLALFAITLTLFLNPNTSETFFTELGKGVALTGFTLLILQVALSARLKFIDRLFGLDVVVRFHKHMAIFAGFLLMSHPVFLALGHGNGWLFSFETGWQLNLGKAALMALLLTILFASSFKMLRLDYQVWRFLHKGAILIIVLGFIHSLVVGNDLQKGEMKIYWFMLLVRPEDKSRSFLCANRIYEAYRVPGGLIWERWLTRLGQIQQNPRN